MDADEIKHVFEPTFAYVKNKSIILSDNEDEQIIFECQHKIDAIAINKSNVFFSHTDQLYGLDINTKEIKKLSLLKSYKGGPDIYGIKIYKNDLILTYFHDIYIYDIAVQTEDRMHFGFIKYSLEHNDVIYVIIRCGYDPKVYSSIEIRNTNGLGFTKSMCLENNIISLNIYKNLMLIGLDTGMIYSYDLTTGLNCGVLLGNLSKTSHYTTIIHENELFYYSELSLNKINLDTLEKTTICNIIGKSSFFIVLSNDHVVVYDDSTLKTYNRHNQLTHVRNMKGNITHLKLIN